LRGERLRGDDEHDGKWFEIGHASNVSFGLGFVKTEPTSCDSLRGARN
jgi:hypothetical protein